MLNGIRCRAYPTAEQAKKLAQWIGYARVIYNSKVVEMQYFRTYSQFKDDELTPYFWHNLLAMPGRRQSGDPGSVTATQGRSHWQPEQFMIQIQVVAGEASSLKCKEVALSALHHTKSA